MQSSIEENILLGSPLDLARLQKAIQYAGLTDDLNSLEDGVKTQIGDQGVNLSGGQKSRICLARALYSKHRILLLDDPLSSCDAKVGRMIFQTLSEALEGRTCLMVTRSFEMLSKMDYILYLEDGKVKEFGKYEAIIAQNLPYFTEFKPNEIIGTTEVGNAVNLASIKLEDKTQAKEFVEKEDQASGFVAFNIYLKFFAPIGLHYLMVVLLIIILLMFGLVGSPLVLAYWSAANAKSDFPYLSWYVGVGVGQLVVECKSI